MKIREDIIEADYFYHIFNRGVNSKLVFLNDENKDFFLLKVRSYLLPYFEIYAYCLMPNHVHFILKAKSEIEKTENSIKFSKGLHSEESVYSKAIGKLISSYTQSFNKVLQRSGSLFESPFKRIRIDSEEYLRNVIIYVHQNPDNFNNYRYSSYKTIISEKITSVSRKEVLDLFDDKENFIKCHKIEIDGEQFEF